MLKDLYIDKNLIFWSVQSMLVIVLYDLIIGSYAYIVDVHGNGCFECSCELQLVNFYYYSAKEQYKSDKD